MTVSSGRSAASLLALAPESVLDVINLIFSALGRRLKSANSFRVLGVVFLQIFKATLGISISIDEVIVSRSATELVKSNQLIPNRLELSSEIAAVVDASE